jgi:hypothetical protein
MTKTTILLAGSFKTSDYRKAIPCAVKLQVLLNHVYAIDKVPAKIGLLVPSWQASDLQFDHRPPLCERDYDTRDGDFIPRQNDPAYIVVESVATHLEKTTGRKAGAARTVTTRGSDVGERARARGLRASQLRVEALHVFKSGRYREAAAMRRQADEIQKPSKHKRKIPSRPFQRKKAS